MPGLSPMPNSAERIEVLIGIQRRRRYPLDEKLAVPTEAAHPGMSISYVARRHGMSPSLLFGWRRRMTEGAKEAVPADDSVVARSEVRALEKRIRGLERVLGKKSLENESLREALKVPREKTLLGSMHCSWVLVIHIAYLTGHSTSRAMWSDMFIALALTGGGRITEGTVAKERSIGEVVRNWSELTPS